MCAGCHPLTNITNSRGNSKEGWDALTSGMIALPPTVKPQVLAYLGDHFPRKPGGEPVPIPGAANISIREWVVPTLGSRPHDPLAAADGSHLVDRSVGERARAPRSEDRRHEGISVADAKSGPHGLTEDKAGNIWYTGNGAGLIGKLDPRTGEVDRIQDARSRCPRSAYAGVRSQKAGSGSACRGRT